MNLQQIAALLGLTVAAISFAGCSEEPPPSDKSNMPPEVKAEEEKFEKDHAKATPVPGKH